MAQSQGLHSLATIIKRLEAVTSRLEDVAHTQSSPAPTSSLKTPTSGTHDLLAGHVASGPPPPPPPPPPAPAPEASSASSPAAQAYQDEIVDGALAQAISAAKAVGGIVEEHTSLLTPLCAAQLAYLQLAGQSAKPAPDAIPALLKPQADAIGAIMEAKDKLSRGKEGREWGACLSVVGEGVSAWGWVQVEPAPAPFVGEMKNSAQFWADRVTKQFKETNPAALAWSKSVMTLIDALQRYVKQWHTTGVVWNPNGQPAKLAATPAPAGTTKPASTATTSGGGGQAALLAELNKGGAVTSGLRKVDASQMTHKNPELRTTSVVPDKKAPPIKAKPGSLSQAPKKPARSELEDGNKWIIENHEDNRDISIDQTELNHTVHVFGCKNTTIRILGKINAVSMVGCKKTAIVMDSAVSSLSITSSPSFEVQVTGSVPTVQIDTTDSGSVYLSQACAETVEIITSKTSSINIQVPSDGGDYEERPVPEQMKSKIVRGKLVTEIVEHAG